MKIKRALQVDTALERVYTAAAKLGIFNTGGDSDPYAGLGAASSRNQCGIVSPHAKAGHMCKAPVYCSSTCGEAKAPKRSRLCLPWPLLRKNWLALLQADVDTADHRELAAEAAREGIVLLKNDGGVLPIPTVSARTRTIALIGPHGNSTTDLLGNPGYRGTNTYVAAATAQ